MPSDMILANTFYPLQIVAGFIGGFIASWIFDRNTAKYAFILPLAYFLLRFCELQTSALSNGLEVRIHYFFGEGCKLPYCYGQFAVTMPLYCSLAYSLAGLLTPSILQLIIRRDRLHQG